MRRGRDREQARAAKAWLTKALRSAPGIGSGVGAVDHFAEQDIVVG